MQSEQQTGLLGQLHSAINLVSMMSPSKMKKNVAGLINLAPQLQENLYEKVDLPMSINKESQPFLETELNRDGDNFRSPHSNSYYPENDSSSYKPSQKYRAFEEMGNLLMTEYTKLYYGPEAVGSFYVLENESIENKFTCGYFVKKSCLKEQNQDGFAGVWDSFNVVDVTVNGHQAQYSLSSTILVDMSIEKNTHGHLDLTGFLKDRFNNQDDVMSSHLVAVGQLIQELETQMRQRLEAIYISKTREVVFTTRYEETRESYNNKYKLAQDLKAVRLTKQN